MSARAFTTLLAIAAITLTIGGWPHPISADAAGTAAITARIASSQATALKIVVIAGEDAVNIVQQKTAVAPVIEVRDRNDLPVSGATVVFTIGGGNTATFAGGAKALTLTTDAFGRATTATLNPIGTGRLPIQIQATFNGQTATTTITQTNVATAAQAATVAGGVGGAATGAVAAGGSGGGLSGGAIAGIVGGIGGGAFAASQALPSDDGGTNGSGAPTATGPSAETIAAAGTYVLQRIDGSPLPALTIPNPPNPCPGFTDSGSITLSVNGTYELMESSHIECPIGLANSFNARFNGNWSILNGAITFTGGGSVNPGSGSLNGSTLTMQFDAPHQNTGNPTVRVTASWGK